jgi:hypothetical protein
MIYFLPYSDNNIIRNYKFKCYLSLTKISIIIKLNMSYNPHLFLLAKTLRSRSMTTPVMKMAIRGGGGGHFHRPDPKVAKPYEHTRLIHLEDINTILYHDFSPEYHMHLHSPFIQNGK